MLDGVLERVFVGDRRAQRVTSLSGADVSLVLLHDFLGRIEDSHCSAMVAFLLELRRILVKGRKDFHRFGGELARRLCASHMVGVGSC
jgi:hypothetical protein